MNIPPLLRIFGYFTIKGDRLPCPPEFSTVLAVAGGATGNESPEQLDSAAEAGADLFESGEIGADVIAIGMNAVTNAVMKFGGDVEEQAKWN